VVLSNGHKVVRPGYTRLTGAATKVTDRGENSGNPNRVNWVSKTEQHYPSLVSQVGRVSPINQDSNTDRQADRVSQVSWLAKTTAQIGKQLWLAELAKIAA
jgi:hypothetical protein